MPPPAKDEKEEKIQALDEEDINILKNYGLAPYTNNIKEIEADISKIVKNIQSISGISPFSCPQARARTSEREKKRKNEYALISAGIKESDTGLAPPGQWDLVADKMAMQQTSLQVFNAKFLEKLAALRHARGATRQTR